MWRFSRGAKFGIAAKKSQCPRSSVSHCTDCFGRLHFSAGGDQGGDSIALKCDGGDDGGGDGGDVLVLGGVGGDD